MKKFYIGVVTCLLSIGFTITSYANVTITPLINKNNLCLNGAFVTIGNIVITESGSKDEFGTGTATNNNLFIIDAPTGFVFNTGATMTIAAQGGGNVTIASASPLFKTASSIGFVYNTDNNATKNTDMITISGLEIKATAMGSGSITLNASSASINGITTGTTSLGNLSTAITTITPATNVVKCKNSANFNLAGYSRVPASGTESFTSALLSPSTPCPSCITGTNTFVPTAATAGTNIITYTVTVGTCTFSATSNIDINAAPTATLTITENSGNGSNDNTICDDNNGNITLSGNGASSYSFIKNNNYGTPIGSTNGMTYSHTNLNNLDKISVIGTDANGCKDTTSQQIINKNSFNVGTFTFNPTVKAFASNAPRVNLFTQAGSPTTPVPGSGTFTGTGVYYTSVPPAGWYFEPAAAQAGPNQVSFHATDGNGCSDSITHNYVVSSGTIPVNNWGPNHCYNGGNFQATVLQSDANVNTGAGNNLIFYYYNYTIADYVYVAATLSGGVWSSPLISPTDIGYSPSYQTSAYIYVYEGVGTSLSLYKGYAQTFINPAPILAFLDDFHSPVFYHCPNETTLQLNTNPASNTSGLSFSFYSNSFPTPVSSGTGNFIHKGAGADNFHYVDWSKARTYPDQNYIVMTYTDPLGCSASLTSTYIYCDPPGAAPTVTGLNPKYYCAGDNVTDALVATKDPTKYIYWYLSPSNTQVLYDASGNTSSSYIPGVLSANTDYYVKQSNTYGTCLSNASNVVTVQVNPPITVSAGLDQTICGTGGVTFDLNYGAGKPSKTIPGFYSSGVTSAWSTSGQGTFNTPGATTPIYTPLGTDISATVNRSVVLTITTADPDGNTLLGCPAVTDNMTLFINEQATINTGGPYVFCASSPTMPLAASSSNNVTIAWSGVQVAPNLSSTTSLAPIYNPTAADKVGGTYNSGTGLKAPTVLNFTITTSDPDGAGPCSSVNSSSTITINPAVSVDAGTDVAVCGHKLIPAGLKVALNSASIKIGGLAGSDRLSGSPVNSWSVVSGLGPITGVNFSSNFHANYNPTGTLADSGHVAPGTGELGNLSIITLKLKSNDPDAGGPCVADSDVVNITIYPRPQPSFIGLSPEFCKNSPAVILSGNLSSRISDNALFTGTAVSTFGSYYKFDPADPTIPATGQDVTLTYKHTDGNTCNNFVDSTVKVYPIPDVKFLMSSRCQNDTITFSDLTSIPSGTYSSGITGWDWKFDNTFSYSTQTAKFSFNNYGTHSARLTVFTNSGGALGCSAFKDSSFIIAPYPTIDYSWFRACSVDSVVFTNNTTIPGGAATYPFGIDWKMGGAGAFKNSTNNTTFSPFYKYAIPGRYNVTLVATTNIYGCKDSLIQEVYVLPTVSVSATKPYAANFKDSTYNWSPSGQNYSWQHGIPTGKSARMVVTDSAWVTKLNGTYNMNEISAMNSPCFNLTNLDKPMVSLHLLSSISNNTLAGGVLQYSKDFGATWSTIGKVGEGSNWYNVSGVVGLIGFDITKNPLAAAWSDTSKVFKSSKIGLSNLANEDTLVRLRLVFASPNISVLDDGLALDSFWIGNRNKTVLLEHFTNSQATACIAANDTVNSIQNARYKDMVSIHYHTSFSGSGADSMNLRNVADPSARALFYGVTQAPTTLLDGAGPGYTTYTGPLSSRLDATDIDAKALENAKFQLDISNVNTPNSLLTKVRIKALENYAGSFIVHTVVLEKNILGSLAGGNQIAAGYKWVVKKMLPDAGGTYFNGTWAVRANGANDTSFVVQSWNYASTDVYNPSELAVVAFIQNSNTKEVYQAAYLAGSGSSNPTSPVVYTAIEMAADISGESIMVFPNPATNEAYVLFGKGLPENCDYVVYDQVGKVVASGRVNKGIEGFSIETSRFAEGAYHIAIMQSNGTKINKQLMVVH